MVLGLRIACVVSTGSVVVVSDPPVSPRFSSSEREVFLPCCAVEALVERGLAKLGLEDPLSLDLVLVPADFFRSDFSRNSQYLVRIKQTVNLHLLSQSLLDQTRIGTFSEV